MTCTNQLILSMMVSEIEFGLLDGGEDDEHDSVGLMDISRR